MAPEIHTETIRRQAQRVLSVGGRWSEKETADRLGVCVRTLRRWTARRRGPPFVLVGRSKKYRPEGVEDWLLKGEQGLDDDQKKHRGKR
jgi:hypothetical protein